MYSFHLIKPAHIISAKHKKFQLQVLQNKAWSVWVGLYRKQKSSTPLPYYDVDAFIHGS